MTAGTAELVRAAERVYENDFQKLAVGPAPEEFLVLEGDFTVKQDGDNKFLELPGAPLDTFGVLFGPTEKEGLAVAAHIFGTGKGRRFPTFAVGLSGGGGYKLQVSPAKKLVEIYRGDAVKTTVPFEWESGKWTLLKLQVEKLKSGAWKVSGKVWNAGQSEPANPTIVFEDKEEPLSGRASIWGSPYSGTPLRFDDLVVSRAGSKP